MCECVCVCLCAKMIFCTMHIQCDLISLCSYTMGAFCGSTLLIFLIIQVKVYSGHAELEKRFPLLAAVNRCAQR